jgi:hypothetical protein
VYTNDLILIVIKYKLVQRKPHNIDSILAPGEMNETTHLIAAVPFSSFSSLVVRKPEEKKNIWH